MEKNKKIKEEIRRSRDHAITLMESSIGWIPAALMFTIATMGFGFVGYQSINNYLFMKEFYHEYHKVIHSNILEKGWIEFLKNRPIKGYFISGEEADFYIKKERVRSFLGLGGEIDEYYLVHPRLPGGWNGANFETVIKLLDEYKVIIERGNKTGEKYTHLTLQEIIDK